MCRTKMATNAEEPRRNTRTRSRSRSDQNLKSTAKSDPSTRNSASGGFSTGSTYKLDASVVTTIVSQTSLSSLRDTLPENAHIYDFAELRSVTNNFLAKRYSSSSSSWRCTLSGKDVIIFQRKFQRSMDFSQLRERLTFICRSHHTSIIKLLGVSISDDHIYLIYDFISGASLSDCLRNPRNPNFTVLSNWMSRMQIATDLAHGLDYIHNNTGLSTSFVHKYIKSGSIIVTEPFLNAKICHFGAAELCGETAIKAEDTKRVDSGVIHEDVDVSFPRELKRSRSRGRIFEGVRGYMSPEFQTCGIATQKSDVYAFGVVILELLSGEEALKYKFNRMSGDYRKMCVVETARYAIEGDGGGGGEEVEARLRKWVDRRLKDSFPVEVAGRMLRVALECVNVDPVQRPGMQPVADKISKLYLDSRVWSDRVRVPTEFSASFAPR